MDTIDRNLIEALREHHVDLGTMIRAEYGRPRPDDAALKRLKLERLHIKEEIDRLPHH